MWSLARSLPPWGRSPSRGAHGAAACGAVLALLARSLGARRLAICACGCLRGRVTFCDVCGSPATPPERVLSVATSCSLRKLTRLRPPASSSTAIVPGSGPAGSKPAGGRAPSPRKATGKLLFPSDEFKNVSALKKATGDISPAAIQDPKLTAAISAASDVSELLSIDINNDDDNNETNEDESDEDTRRLEFSAMDEANKDLLTMKRDATEGELTLYGAHRTFSPCAPYNYSHPPSFALKPNLPTGLAQLASGLRQSPL